MNPKISIIVPVYKVEEYIHKCIKSILTQTFSDFELILVNDGSPDKCGEICDVFALMDSRVKVIHKENGGLSDARNAGLNVAQGDYIGFVDSDDWIESDMYEILYKVCIENNSDMAVCTSIIHFKDRIKEGSNHPLMIHNKTEAMRHMLTGELYDEVVWTKLIKRSVLNNIRFKKGFIYEDTGFTYKVIHQCNSIASIGAAKYHYIKRDNGLMNKALKDIRIDSVVIYLGMFKFMCKFYPELHDLTLLKLSNSALTVLNLVSRSKRPVQYNKQFNIAVEALNKNFYKIIRLKDYPRNLKVLLIATKINPKLYRLIINLINRRKERNEENLINNLQ